MKITKYSFYLIMLVYMGFQAFTHLTLNTTTTGTTSQLYLGWFIGDLLLAFVTFNHLQLSVRGRILDAKTAKKIDADSAIDLNVSHFGFTDYIYYIIILLYMLFNAVQHVQGNTVNTGITSIWYALWTAADVGLSLLSAQQLYLIVTGQQVKMTKSDSSEDAPTPLRKVV
jgi:hypothetical protein